MANEAGNRYFCQTCSGEFIVTKGGTGAMECHGQLMTKK